MIDEETVSHPSLSWVHFGDLHIQSAEDDNYLDFLDLIEEVNAHLAGHVDFAFLPGDNADDGLEPQYRLVREALNKLPMPVYAITGDHDKKAGSLNLFQQYLEPDMCRAVNVRGFRLLFLNVMDGATKTSFDLGSAQIAWLERELHESRTSRLRPLIFTHLYPSELLTQADMVTQLIRRFQVELVEMGHTHYNELANDGRTIYATTRSTGQIEEGPPGFSLTVLYGDVVSWKFKELGQWPLVMITSPADQKLITPLESANQVVRGFIPIRARVWGGSSACVVSCSIDEGEPHSMQFADGAWTFLWNSSSVPDGTHRIAVTAKTGGSESRDEISVCVSQAGRYTPPVRSSVDHENVIGAWPAKGILGTQLGPNEKGTKGPWPSWRKPSQ